MKTNAILFGIAMYHSSIRIAEVNHFSQTVSLWWYALSFFVAVVGCCQIWKAKIGETSS